MDKKICILLHTGDCHYITCLFFFINSLYEIFGSKLNPIFFGLEACCLLSAITFFMLRTETFQFLHRTLHGQTTSKELEKRFLKKGPEDYIFPEKKRNLIIIHLEGIENGYKNSTIYGCNLIPYLSKLQSENVSFYGNIQVLGSAWTRAFLTNLQYGLYRHFVPDPISEKKKNSISLDSGYSLNEILSGNDLQTACH